MHVFRRRPAAGALWRLTHRVVAVARRVRDVHPRDHHGHAGGELERRGEVGPQTGAGRRQLGGASGLPVVDGRRAVAGRYQLPVGGDQRPGAGQLDRGVLPGGRHLQVHDAARTHLETGRKKEGISSRSVV